ncbi:helix-turn-helix domain-containing protein [Acinetobacter sp. ME22]|uniref:helix-turn-helix domain-containing protein n=1 Tax=Acinetobacter sp. ME22 TaxID=2904802 RepID=UPI001EDBC3F9|nr:helix-turn-helix transcriptional regulator [Acinetobacter sp. ME22]MCG2572020.1 helix-turn-helix domain-containing protein [Acinetobacter sp. ME22]
MAFKSNENKRALIGIKLCAARKLSKMTQTDVMLKVFNVKNPNQKNRISEIESGKVAPDSELLQELCLLYGVSADWILGFTVEPEIDLTASRVGLLYNGMAHALSPLVERIIEQVSGSFAEAGSQYLASLPNSGVLALIQNSKKIINEIHDGHVTKESLATLMETVRECDVLLSRNNVKFFSHLDDLCERDESNVNEMIIKSQEVPVAKRQDRRAKMQLDIFEVAPNGCR